jgi:hypothetical protein
MESDSVLATNKNDVVSGRGSGGNRHPGNIYFRELIKSNKAYYLSLSKNQKMDVARAIYDKISSLDPPGRFLNKNPETENWYIVKKDRALEKIYQALREKPAALKKGRSQGFVEKKGIGMIDPAAMILGRGIPNVIGSQNANAHLEELYSSNYDQMQGPSQMTMAQKMQYQQYQHQLNMMDMMQGGPYPASMPQRNMFPAIPGGPFGGYPIHQMAGSGYPTQPSPYSENGGYMDRANYTNFHNSMMAQLTRPGEQALSKHENANGSKLSNGDPLASIPDHHRMYIAASSGTLSENPYTRNVTASHPSVDAHLNQGAMLKGMVLPEKDMGENNSQGNMEPKIMGRNLSPPQEDAEVKTETSH